MLVPAGRGKQITSQLAAAQVLPAVPAATPQMARSATALAGRESPSARSSGEGRPHVVKGGESLASVARSHGMEPRTLAEFNGMLASEPLLPGQTLRIPGDASSAAVLTHRVARGDSLDTIARRYGVTVRDIKRWNRFAANEVKVGDLIRIRKGSS
jgi:membrane-bound lytic murein transglycosylase D